MEHFGDGSAFGVRMEYRVQHDPIGTAGSVLQCRDFYGKDDFLVMSGDAVCDFDLRGLYERHRQAGAAVTMALHPNAEPLRYGLVLLDRQSRVRHFVEKPDWPQVVTNLVSTGIYVLSPRAMSYVPEGQPFDFAKHLFPMLLQSGETILGVPMDGYWRDIGTPRDYYQCGLDLTDGRLRTDPVQEAAEPPSQAAVGAAFPCRDRARLMRTASEAFMEAGADFTDGLHFRDGSWDVRVRPDENESALRIEANDPRAERSVKHLLELMEKASD
jgi:mannose-1-phosphate guanylyltransferase/phosphomannomutase